MEKEEKKRSITAQNSQFTKNVVPMQKHNLRADTRAAIIILAALVTPLRGSVEIYEYPRYDSRNGVETTLDSCAGGFTI